MWAKDNLRKLFSPLSVRGLWLWFFFPSYMNLYLLPLQKGQNKLLTWVRVGIFIFFMLYTPLSFPFLSVLKATNQCKQNSLLKEHVGLIGAEHPAVRLCWMWLCAGKGVCESGILIQAVCSLLGFRLRPDFWLTEIRLCYPWGFH